MCDERKSQLLFLRIRCCKPCDDVGARATRARRVEGNVERRGCWRRGRTWRVVGGNGRPRRRYYLSVALRQGRWSSRQNRHSLFAREKRCVSIE